MKDLTSHKTRNSKISIALIVANLILAIILSNAGKPAGDMQETNTLGYIIAACIILFGGFAFTYHGKEYRWAKWLFGISIIIGIIFFALLFYAMSLAKAFQH